MWEQGRPDLLRGIVVADPVPDDGDNRRWGVSIIARISPTDAPLFTDVRNELLPWTGSQHTLYDASNLHTTIRSCEFYRSTVSPDDAALRDYQSVLLEVAAEVPPFTIAYRGLSANRTGVIVQGFPHEHLQNFRHSIRQRLEKFGRTRGPEASRTRRGAHVSLIVWAGPLLAPQPLVTYIDAHRATDYGTVTVTHLEVVRYRRTRQQVALVPYAEAVLGSA